MSTITKKYQIELYARLMGEAQRLGIPSEVALYKGLLDILLCS